jgi:hypothetical protein
MVSVSNDSAGIPAGHLLANIFSDVSLPASVRVDRVSSSTYPGTIGGSTFTTR